VLADISPVTQDYLKVIWNAREWSDAAVTSKMLAERMDVSASTVSETVRRLTEQGLVQHAPYAAIDLTETGRTLALAVVRRHRLLETYLLQELNYTWDEVHAEAEVLEHAVSDTLIERIAAKLGHPRRDPHGDPIPTADGHVQVPDAVLLDELDSGGRGTVARISDDDPDTLRHFTSTGIVLDAAIRVDRRTEAVDTLVLHVGDSSEEVTLGRRAARTVWVSPLPDAVG